jgi:hypothetical protein
MPSVGASSIKPNSKALLEQAKELARRRPKKIASYNGLCSQFICLNE